MVRIISGYIIKKKLYIHSCEGCKNYATSHENLGSSSLFCYFKKYRENCNFGKLKMPGDDFLNYIGKLEKMF
jgi:hypothetical protein